MGECCYYLCSPGTFVALAPGRIRLGSPYTVAVNVLKSENTKPVTVTLKVLDTMNKTLREASQSVTVGTVRLLH